MPPPNERNSPPNSTDYTTYNQKLNEIKKISQSKYILFKSICELSNISSSSDITPENKKSAAAMITELQQLKATQKSLKVEKIMKSLFLCIQSSLFYGMILFPGITNHFLNFLSRGFSTWIEDDLRAILFTRQKLSFLLYLTRFFFMFFTKNIQEATSDFTLAFIQNQGIRLFNSVLKVFSPLDVGGIVSFACKSYLGVLSLVLPFKALSSALFEDYEEEEELCASFLKLSSPSA